MHETFCLLDRAITKTNIDNRLGSTLCEHRNTRFIDVDGNSIGDGTWAQGQSFSANEKVSEREEIYRLQKWGYRIEPTWPLNRIHWFPDHLTNRWRKLGTKTSTTRHLAVHFSLPLFCQNWTLRLDTTALRLLYSDVSNLRNYPVKPNLPSLRKRARKRTVSKAAFWSRLAT